jgi:oligopeptide/dipeptide ABC transporter ATP-binding protein
MTDGPILKVSDLSVEFRLHGRRHPMKAVNDVSLFIRRGETLGLVGESGSGKSTLARAVLGLVKPSAGRIYFEGRDITNASTRERRRIAAEMSVVFQDPYSSLNPALTIGTIMREPLLVRDLTRGEVRNRISSVLDSVGMPAADTVTRYPRQFSGGQRQRIAIARALTVRPKLIICDEPVSSLDLSIQAQIINLLADLREEMSLAMLFVAHDLSVVRHTADRTAVLLHGQVMEVGPSNDVHDRPQHPYSQSLSASALVSDPAEQLQRRLARQKFARPRTERLAVPIVLPGCPFAARCPHRMDVCYAVRPSLVQVSPDTQVACHLFTQAVPSASSAAEADAGQVT